MTHTHDRPNPVMYIAPLRRFRAPLALFCGSAVLTSFILTYVMSEKYMASNTIVYQPSEAVTFRPKTQDALGFPMPLVGLESIGATLDEILKSDALLEQVVNELHLDHTPPPTGSWLMRTYKTAKDYFKKFRIDTWQVLQYGRVLPANPYWDAVTGLRKNVTLKRTPKAYTFEVQAIDTDPIRAASIVDTISRDVADLVAKMDARAAHESRRRLKSHLAETVRDLRQARASLDEIRSKGHFSSLDEELSLRLKSVNSFEQELATSDNELTSLQKERAAVQEQLDSQPPSIVYSSTNSDNPVADTLRKDLASQELERAELLESLTPSHPKVKALDARMAETRNRLSNEKPMLVSAESSGINEVRQKLLTKKFEVESQIAALAAKQQSLSATVAAQSTEARVLSGDEGKLQAAQLALAAAEKNYELTNEAYEEARLAEVNAASEVMVLTTSAVPRAPFSPIKIYHVAATLLLSLFLGGGFAFVADYLDPYLRRVGDAEALLGAPVLGSISTSRSPEDVFPQLYPTSELPRERP